MYNVFLKDLKDALNPLPEYHLRNHYPHHRGFLICNDVNMRIKRHCRRGDRSGQPHDELHELGDHVTMDVITMERIAGEELTPEEAKRRKTQHKCCLIIYDLWSGWLQIYDLKRHDTECIVAALRHFAGVREGPLVKKIRYMYQDGAG